MSISVAIREGTFGATDATMQPCVSIAHPPTNHHLRPKISETRPTMMKPMEVVSRYERDTQMILASGPIFSLTARSLVAGYVSRVCCFNSLMPRIGAARVKPPTPNPKLRPMANMDPRNLKDLKLPLGMSASFTMKLGPITSPT